VNAIPWFETRRFATLLTMRDRYDGPQIDLILRAAEGRVSKDRGRSLRCWAYVSAYALSRRRRVRQSVAGFSAGRTATLDRTASPRRRAKYRPAEQAMAPY